MSTRRGTIVAGTVPLCAAHLPTSASVSARAVRVLLRWPGTATPPELAAENVALSEGVEEVVEVSSVVFQWTGSGGQSLGRGGPSLPTSRHSSYPWSTNHR